MDDKETLRLKSKVNKKFIGRSKISIEKVKVLWYGE